MYDRFGQYYPDSEGGLWTEKAIKNYVYRQNCFVNQYSSYSVTRLNRHVNGKLTLTENIADNGGIKASYRVMNLEFFKLYLFLFAFL